MLQPEGRPRIWVKICANTCVEDTLKAVELGADAVGFVFAPSSRQVTAEQVAEITRKLPLPVERVGVFGPAQAEEIARVVEIAQLSAVQLHGGFDRTLTKQLTELLGEQISIIQTVHWDVGEEGSPEFVAQRLAEIVHSAPHGRVLVDAKVGSASGGTGVTFDWERAREGLRGKPGVIVAGGLRPENVASAIRLMQPSGVDVASGVEAAPGRKDHRKLQAFIENARGA